MHGFLSSFSDSFMPHGFCLQWDARLVALIVVSNALIALAYYSIPLSLVLLVRQTSNPRFTWLFFMFAAFILLCGTTHIMGIVTIWHGSYWLEAIIEGLTAVVSVATAISIWPLLPRIVSTLNGGDTKLLQSSNTKIPFVSRATILNLVLGASAFLITTFLVYHQMLLLLETRAQITRSHEFRTALESTLNSVEQSETRHLGYFITGDPRYMQPSTGASKELAEELVQIERLSSGGQQEERVARLKRLIEERRIDLQSTLAISAQNGRPAALAAVKSGRGEQQLQEIRELAQSIEAAEKFNLDNHTNRVSRGVTDFFVAMSGLVLLGFILIASFLYFLSRNLTERQESDLALRKSEEMFRLLVSAVTDYAIIMIDTNGRVVSWNQGAQRIMGYSASEITGQSYEQFFVLEAEAGQRGTDVITSAMEKGHFQDQCLQKRKDGSSFWAEVVVAPVYDTKNALTGFAAVTKDITERKEAEQRLEKAASELKRSNTELQSFAYIASHDLQEPLRVIVSFADLLEENCQDKFDQEGKEFLGYIVDATKQMRQLVRDLLAYVRIEKSETPVTLVDTQEVLSQAIADLRTTLENSGASIEHGELPPVLIDKGQLKQLFINLLDNAIKFRGEEPVRINLTADRENDYCRFSLQDNSIGFDMQHSEKVFVIFQRLHARTKYQGTGVGLAICKKIVENASGKIWVQSEPGKGTTFFFTLPAVTSIQGATLVTQR